MGQVHPGKMCLFDLHCGMNSTRSKALQLGTQRGGISGSGSSPAAELGVWLTHPLPGTQDTSPTHAEATRSRADIVLFCLGRGAQSWNLPLATRLAGGPLFTLSPPDPLSPAEPGTRFSLCILPDLRRTHGFTRWQVKKSVRAFVILEYLQHGENHKLQKEACLLFVPSACFIGDSIVFGFKVSISSRSFHLCLGAASCHQGAGGHLPARCPSLAAPSSPGQFWVCPLVALFCFGCMIRVTIIFNFWPK